MVAQSLKFSEAQRQYFSSPRKSAWGFYVAAEKGGNITTLSSPFLFVALPPTLSSERFLGLEHGRRSGLLEEAAVPLAGCGETPIFPRLFIGAVSFFLPSAESQPALLLIFNSQQLLGGGVGGRL